MFFPHHSLSYRKSMNSTVIEPYLGLVLRDEQLRAGWHLWVGNYMHVYVLSCCDALCYYGFGKPPTTTPTHVLVYFLPLSGSVVTYRYLDPTLPLIHRRCGPSVDDRCGRRRRQASAAKAIVGEHDILGVCVVSGICISASDGSASDRERASQRDRHFCCVLSEERWVRYYLRAYP